MPYDSFIKSTFLPLPQDDTILIERLIALYKRKGICFDSSVIFVRYNAQGLAVSHIRGGKRLSTYIVARKKILDIVGVFLEVSL